jgi:hypothetical protein
MPRKLQPLWDRFWAKVDQSAGLDACWPWMGATSKKRGGSRRGHIQLGRRGSPVILAHVVALALSTDGDFVKIDPDTGERLEASHRCHARWGNCCNPRHLYWGTAAQNRADRYGTATGPLDNPSPLHLRSLLTRHPSASPPI